MCLVACVGNASPEVTCTASKVVYGSDDRRDLLATDEPWVSLSARVVALIPKADFEAIVEQPALLREYSARKRRRLCEDEAFNDEPALAECSGVLLTPDLVLTAGHCIAGDACEAYIYTLDFANLGGERSLTITREHGRECQRVEFHTSYESGDFALVRLASPAPAVPEVRLSTQDPELGGPVFLLGFPSGLPLKLRSGSIVFLPEDGRSFGTDLDAFSGDSGGAVFDQAGALLGTMQRGQADFTWDAAAECVRARRVTADPTSGLFESATLVVHVLEEACHAGVADSCNALEARRITASRSACQSAASDL